MSVTGVGILWWRGGEGSEDGGELEWSCCWGREEGPGVVIQADCTPMIL